MKKLIINIHAPGVNLKIYNGVEVVLSAWIAFGLNADRFIYIYNNMKGDM